MVPTRDHECIRQWATRHAAVPAQLRRLKHDGEPAVLTFTFGQLDAEAKQDIYPISWQTFFALFDLLKLSIAFDEKTPRFNIVRVDEGRTELLH